MLKVASFPITDANGINELLSKYRLAQGAHILVSEGSVCIPYEDGEPDNKALRSIFIAEMRNKKLAELAIMEQSQEVLKREIKDAEDQYNALEATAKPLQDSHTKDDRDHLEQIEERMKFARSKGNQLMVQKLQNEYELNNIKVNIDTFDETIESLK